MGGKIRVAEPWDKVADKEKVVFFLFLNSDELTSWYLIVIIGATQVSFRNFRKLTLVVSSGKLFFLICN